MKKTLILLAAALPFLSFSQTSNATTFSSGSENTEKFTNKSRLFKDWSITVGGGTAFMIHSDLTSFYGGKVNWGWNGIGSINKQINQAFALSLFYQQGKTNQKAFMNAKSGLAHGWTKYRQVGLLGDVNFSNLMRRVDNHSNFKWSLHGYAGIGFMGYDTYLEDNSEFRTGTPYRRPLEINQKLDINSIAYNFGLGFRYNVSKLVDLELRTMYLISGDDTFDGSGYTDPGDYDPSRQTYTQLNDRRSDNLLSVNLAVNFKIGNKDKQLGWFDPLQDIYNKTKALEENSKDFVVCEKGDQDNDGVCDDWDRELNTPAGARVDGAGVALDMDLDGVIDLYDKCVTVPGPKENDGCPLVK